MGNLKCRNCISSKKHWKMADRFALTEPNLSAFILFII